MNRRLFLPSLFFLLILGSALSALPIKDTRAASLKDEKTLVLYDAASNTIPNESFMDFTDFPQGTASLSYSDGAADLDTTVSGSDTFAGWVSGQAIVPGFPILDRTGGFQVNFTLQVVSEIHTRDNRAGFSVIILDNDAQGIELSFWENEIWAQNDDHTGSLFTHGEGITFATTGLTEYQVSIAGDTYTLTANSGQLLTGPVRDYSSFDRFPDPYETPNFLFWGDDSTSAQSQVRLHFVSVTGTEPVLPTSTGTSIGTSNPLPTASRMAPSATPASSPTPVAPGRGFELCSPGWLVFTISIPYLVITKKNRRKKAPF